MRDFWPKLVIFWSKCAIFQHICTIMQQKYMIFGKYALNCDINVDNHE